MTEINERVTVDFDEQSYYLDGEYWESWDNYGEEMADKINELLNELSEENQQLKERNEGIASTNWEVKKILINYLTTNKYKSEKEVIKEIQKAIKLEMI